MVNINSIEGIESLIDKRTKPLKEEILKLRFELEELKQALRIHDVVGRSEQLACDGCGESVRVNKKGDWIICSECGYQKEAN